MLTSGKEEVLTCMLIHILDQTTSEGVVPTMVLVGGTPVDWEVRQKRCRMYYWFIAVPEDCMIRA